MTNDRTPVMDEGDRHVAQELSLQHIRPPIHLPGYEQEKFLGKGAFGEVWVAINSNNGRKVAIKFYNRRGGLDWSLLTREVEKLRHLFTDRYVVQLFEVGWDADPPYYAMEYMENGSLEEKLRAGPLAVPEAVELFHEIAVGLVHAHGKGILHCDLKPANILLDQDHKPRLADFGQSRLSKEQSPALGTLFYMAPEQADLQAVPDARWDVYALGAILYCMLTGQPPYRTQAGATEIMSAGHLDERLQRYRRLLTASTRAAAHRSVPGIDAALVEIVDRCLAVKPHARYPNVQAVLDALRARKTKQARRPLLLLGTLGPALVMLVMAVYAVILYSKTTHKAEYELIDRTLEVNQFAARGLSEQFGRQIAKRWGVLEREAYDVDLRKKMLALAGNQAGDKSRVDELQTWLESRSAYWDKASSRGGPLGAQWFLDDQKGYLRAITPRDDDYLNHYFGYRDYFHGQGGDLAKDAPTPGPITRPHLSIPFPKREGKGVWTVAFSVPIWAPDSVERRPVGVLGVLVDLTGIPKVEGPRHQIGVLVDTRPNHQGLRGMILQHPYQEDVRWARGSDFRPVYNSDIGQLGDQLRQPRHKGGASAGALPTVFRNYRDPVGEEHKEYAGPWLAALAPVLVPDRPEEIRDSGWVIVVQERADEALQPLHDLSSQLVSLAAQSAVVVLLVVLALWGGVWLTQADSRGRRLLTSVRRKLGLSMESAFSSASSSSSSSSVQTPAKQPASGAG
jgi:serine/threonine protein kinase